MKTRDRHHRWDRGLQTTGGEYSGRPDDFTTFQDVILARGRLDNRGGMARLARLTSVDGNIMSFDGTNDRVDFPTLTALPLVFTVELVWVTDSLAANRQILGKQGASAVGLSIVHTSTSTVTVTFRDSGGSTTTLTWTGVGAADIHALQIVRNGASFTGWLDGVTQTGVVSASLLGATGALSAGTDNGATWFLGSIDYLRIWDVARTERRDLNSRLLNPRNRHVMYCWVFTQGSADDIIDQGIRVAHATTAGSPTWASRGPLVTNPWPIQGMGYSVRANGDRELVVANGGRVHSLGVS